MSKPTFRLELGAVGARGGSVTPADAMREIVDDLERRELPRVMKNLAERLLRTLERVHRRMEEKHGAAWPASGMPFGTDPRRQRLLRRSGRSLQAIRDSIKVTRSSADRTVQGTISLPANLAVHETGGVIRPRRRENLLIPFVTALDSRGLPRYRQPKRLANTFVRRTKRGNLVVFRRKRDGAIEPLYLLKPEVNMPPRMGFTKTLEEELGHFERKALDALQRTLLR